MDGILHSTSQSQYSNGAVLVFIALLVTLLIVIAFAVLRQQRELAVRCGPCEGGAAARPSTAGLQAEPATFSLSAGGAAVTDYPTTTSTHSRTMEALLRTTRALPPFEPMLDDVLAWDSYARYADGHYPSIRYPYWW